MKKKDIKLLVRHLKSFDGEIEILDNEMLLGSKFSMIRFFNTKDFDIAKSIIAGYKSITLKKIHEDLKTLYIQIRKEIDFDNELNEFKIIDYAGFSTYKINNELGIRADLLLKNNINAENIYLDGNGHKSLMIFDKFEILQANTRLMLDI